MFTEHCTCEQNIQSFQVCVNSSRYTICWAVKQASISFPGLKSWSMYFNYNGIKIEINIRKISKKWKSSHVWQWNTLNNACVKEEITREMRTHLWLKDNEDLTWQNWWHEALSVAYRGRDNYNAYIRKEGKFQINDVSFCLQNQKSSSFEQKERKKEWGVKMK